MTKNILTNIPDISYSEKEPLINVEEFIKVVESRRSVRVFEKFPIPEEVMNSCLDHALLAPNSSNLQMREFYWIRSAKLKEELIKACIYQTAAKTAAELVVCVARTDTWKENNRKMINTLEEFSKSSSQAIYYYKKIVPLAYSLGIFGIFGLLKKIILFFRGFKTPTIRVPTTYSELITWAVKSTALACENFMLAIRAYSYDSCPMEGFDSVMIKKVLNLPKHAHIVMVIACGKRASNGIYGARIRFDRKDFIKEV